MNRYHAHWPLEPLTISHHLVSWTARAKVRRLQRRYPTSRYRVLPAHNAIWRWRVVAVPRP
jgi:hypothetical protein